MNYKMVFFVFFFVFFSVCFFFFFNDTATTEIYTLSLHDALPISPLAGAVVVDGGGLQNSASWTLIAGGDFFAVEESGYQSRSSAVHAYKDGVEVRLPATVLEIGRAHV